MGNLPSSPTAPTITEKTLGDHGGKVYMITGATSGIGFELARVLYAANATVWVVARSEQKCLQAMQDIRSAAPSSRGELKYLLLDFNDLGTIKPAAERFCNTETRLDVLWNNAGIMIPPKGTRTKQDHEAQLGVNVLAPFLFTKLIYPVLSITAKTSPVRVVWVSSSAAAGFSPDGGIDMAALEHNKYSQWQNYGISKAGAILLSAEYAKRHDGISSVAVDPGNLDTALYVNMPRYQRFVAKKLALKPAIYGAYTELFAGFAATPSDVAWVVPWGQTDEPRQDIEKSCRSKNAGGTGVAEEFWEWCELKTQTFA